MVIADHLNKKIKKKTRYRIVSCHGIIMGTWDNKEMKFHPLYKRVGNKVVIHFRTITITMVLKVLT